MKVLLAVALGLLIPTALASADEIDRLYPLGDDLKVLAADAASPEYRKLVDGMNGPDLEAEWRRVETSDNAEAFAEKHGGREKVLADPQLAQAYQRRAQIREQFLEVMRAGFKRLGKEAPFDRNVQAEPAGTMTRELKITAPRLEIVPPAAEADRHWPRFRGPTGQGMTDQTPLPIEWSPEKNVVWKAEVPGDGNSSPVIWGNQIFLTSAGPEGQDRALHCFDRTTGKLLWTATAPEHTVERQVRDKNGFASATPVTDGQRVIVYFGAGGLLCYDMQGNLQWHYATPGFDSLWGSGASPLLYEDLVILVHDQNRAPSLAVALKKETGEVVWEQTRERAMGWATPVVVRVGDHDELIYPGNRTVKAYDPRTGRERWTLSGPTEEVIPTIIVGERMVYSASGRQGPTLGILPGGQGDVTASHLVWRTVRGGPHVPCPILVGGRLYTINDFGIATSIDAETGKLIWQARVRDKFSASPIESDGLLYFPAESGITYVLRAADQFEIVAENDLQAPILASPAALAGRLYLRAGQTLYCIADGK